MCGCGSFCVTVLQTWNKIQIRRSRQSVPYWANFCKLATGMNWTKQSEVNIFCYTNLKLIFMSKLFSLFNLVPWTQHNGNVLEIFCLTICLADCLVETTSWSCLRAIGHADLQTTRIKRDEADVSSIMDILALPETAWCNIDGNVRRKVF